MDATGVALTLRNHTGSDGLVDEFREYFGRFDVAVRAATLSTDTPTTMAILHRGADALATSALSELDAAIGLEALETDDLAAVPRPDVLEHLDWDQYAIEDGTKLEVVRISRLIGTRALEAGRGTLHAGFQRVDRIRDERNTRDLYERIAGTDVTVHLYGRPGDVPNEELYRLHTVEGGELAESWFVVYDGAGRDARKAAELCEETGPERYTGFWTYRPAVVDAAASYLDATYATA